MSLTRLAVYRPVTTTMCCLIIVLLGWQALMRLPVDLMPNIIYPTISVTTLYRGAGPEEIETLVTRPMEQAINSVQGVEQLASRSMEGSSEIRVRMLWGTNIDSAVNDIRAKIERLRESFPDDVQTPSIRRYDVSDSPIIYLGLKTSLDPIQTTRLAEHTIVPQLESLDGVAWVRVRGGTRREIQIDLNRRKLEALNMGVNDVVTALRRENVNQPAGDFAEGNVNLLIRSRGEFHSLEQISNTVVRESGGAVVKIRDIATVVDGEERRTELTRVNGTPGLLIYVFRQSGSNTVEVSNRVREAVENINLSLRNAQLRLRHDKSDYIRQSIANLKQSAIYGMGLAVVVLIVFLRSFRSTLVIAVSMPLSILATFVLIHFMGFTLNMISFGGLALGIGLLVDNSIVVIESIFRKREDGLDSKAAAIEGTREVGSAIIASTLTTLIVFVPLLFIDGMTGVMLHQLAWVVSFSLFCSLIASLTLTPMLAAYWVPEQKPSSLIERMIAVFTNLFHTINRAFFSVWERVYEAGLKVSLRFSWGVGFVLMMLLATTIGLAPRIGTEFLPKTDEGDLRVETRMAPGIQLARLDAQARLLEDKILTHVPEGRTTAAFIGGDADDADDWNEAWFRTNLTPRSKRTRSADDIRKELAKLIGELPGMNIRVTVRSDVGLANFVSRGNGGQVEVLIRGYDVPTAEELSMEVERVMNSIPGLVNVETEREDKRPELSALIDREKASLLGVSVSDITQTLETTIRGTDTTIFREEGDEFNVLVRLREADRSRVADVEQVGVSTPTGEIVPLKNFVKFDPEAGRLSIKRLDQQRVLEVSADVEDRDLGSVVESLQKELNKLPLPEGFTVNIAGDWEEQQKSFASLRQGLVLAVLLMYMVMASQFESLRDPLLILVTIPLGAIGVILILLGTDTTLNVQSFIGLVILSGIVVNNAIVLVDYINQLRRNEPDTELKSIVIRASVRRFRPILMTTLTTILAMLPIALGWGEGGELQAPLARVVIGGMVSGTLITLLAIPMIYLAFEPKRAPIAD